MTWTIDIPNKERFHVGGSFNNIMNCWPHKYFVFQGTKLIYRSEFYVNKDGERYIKLSHLEEFLEM
jgi:hypothetical protein